MGYSTIKMHNIYYCQNMCKYDFELRIRNCGVAKIPAYQLYSMDHLKYPSIRAVRLWQKS